MGIVKILLYLKVTQELSWNFIFLWMEGRASRLGCMLYFVPAISIIR